MAGANIRAGPAATAIGDGWRTVDARLVSSYDAPPISIREGAKPARAGRSIGAAAVAYLVSINGAAVAVMIGAGAMIPAVRRIGAGAAAQVRDISTLCIICEDTAAAPRPVAILGPMMGAAVAMMGAAVAMMGAAVAMMGAGAMIGAVRRIGAAVTGMIGSAAATAKGLP